MGFELRYYQCPKCNGETLAKNLDTGAFVCDNSEGGCTHRIDAKEDYQPYIVREAKTGCSSSALQGASLARDVATIRDSCSAFYQQTGKAEYYNLMLDLTTILRKNGYKN